MQASNTNSLSTWFNSMKADDIDGGLAADFDGSLSGLGTELGSTTYNMSEALLALPVFKQESFEQGFTYILCASTSPATKVNEETLTYMNQGQSYEIKLKRLGDLGDLKGKLLRSKIRVVFHERRLQYMEKEQLDTWKTTRPGERILDIDIPLSCGICDIVVDPGQLNLIEFVWDPNKEVGVYCKVHSISTEFTAKKHGGEKGVPFRVQVETYAIETDNTERLIHCASCQVKVFKPKGADRKNKTDKERIEKKSTVDKEKYQPSYECTVLTEIPIMQVLNYLDQVKKQQLESSLNDMQIKKNRKPVVKSDTITKATSSLKIEDEVRNFAVISDNSNSNSQEQQEGIGVRGGGAVLGAGGGGVGKKTPPGVKHHTKSTLKKIKSSGSLPNPILAEETCSLKSWEETKVSNLHLSPEKQLQPPQLPASPQQLQSTEPLPLTASANEVTQWLKANRFQNFIKVFQNFSGADLLRLSREDLIQICGLADGIRLNNALQAKALRPKLILYVCQMTMKQRFSTQHRSEHSTPSPSSSPSNTSLTTTASPSSQAIPFISPPHFIPPQTPEEIIAAIDEEHHNPVTTTSATIISGPSVKPVSMVSENELNKLQLSNKSMMTVVCQQNDKNRVGMETAAGAKTISNPVLIPISSATDLGQNMSVPDIHTSLDALMKELVTPSSFQSATARPSTEHINIISSSAGLLASPSASESLRHRHSTPKLQLTQSSKRQYREFNEDVDESELFYSKKQRTRNLELSKKGVYHALYLEHLSLSDLREKMATLYSLQTSQVREVYVQGPSGIHVLVTDEVVQNFQDETRYFIEVTQDEDSLGVYPEYYVYLKNST